MHTQERSALSHTAEKKAEPVKHLTDLCLSGGALHHSIKQSEHNWSRQALLRPHAGMCFHTLFLSTCLVNNGRTLTSFGWLVTFSQNRSVCAMKRKWVANSNNFNLTNLLQVFLKIMLLRNIGNLQMKHLKCKQLQLSIKNYVSPIIIFDMSVKIQKPMNGPF